MFAHFTHLIVRSILLFPTVLSGNWLSIFVPLLFYAVREGSSLRRGWSEMKVDFWRDTKIVVAVYAVLFAWAIIQEVYRDHIDLVGHALQMKQRADSLEVQSAPKLDGSFQGTMIAPGGQENQNTIYTSVVSITDTGAPSIVRNFRLSLNLPDGHIVEGRILLSPGKGHRLILKMASGGEVNMDGADFLPQKAQELPIPTNGASAGFIQALFENVTPDVAERSLFSPYV